MVILEASDQPQTRLGDRLVSALRPHARDGILITFLGILTVILWMRMGGWRSNIVKGTVCSCSVSSSYTRRSYVCMRHRLLEGCISSASAVRYD